MGIPVALTYTTTMSGRVPKLVQCEKCSVEYVYLLERSVSAEGTSLLFLDNAGASQRASARAEAALHQSLAEGCEPVPCPECGTVQQHMFSRARQLRHRWMLWAGIIALSAGAILAIPATIYSLIDSIDGPGRVTVATITIVSVVSVLIVSGIALLVSRVFLNRSYDPNSEPVETRKSRGQSLAARKQDFLNTLPKQPRP